MDRGADELSWSDDVCRAYTRYMERNVRHDHRPIAQRIVADWPEVPTAPTVVDVAGGPAFVLLELAPWLTRPRLVVTDASGTMIALAHERARARGVAIEGAVCPAEALTLDDGIADLVVCKHYLRLSPDVDAALGEMARILAPGGRAYLVDFDPAGPRLRGALVACGLPRRPRLAP